MKLHHPFLIPYLFLIFFMLLFPSLLSAQEIPEGLNPEAAFLARISGLFIVEDPSSIYNFDVYDEKVEFILDGSWEAKLDSVLDITFDGDTPVLSGAPPVFSQIVDLSSWVFINKSWYFESSFAEQFTKNSVAAGYLGNETTPVKHVRLGNSGILFPDKYPFVRIGGGAAISPGIMGTFAGDTWQADTVIRYDSAAARELVLSGMNEVNDGFIPVTAFIQGKWFVLPDTHITGSVSVYVQNEGGPIRDEKGRRWRELNISEFRVSGIDGIIELAQETGESVAVVYSSPAANLEKFIDDTRDYFTGPPVSLSPEIIDSYLKDNTARFLLKLDGKSALLLRERGYFSPFAVSSRYKAEGLDMEAVFMESGIKPRGLSVSDYDGMFAELSRTDSGGIRSVEARFPLAQDFPLLYFPSFGGQIPDTDLSIRSRLYKPVTSISLGSEVIAGTIQVTRDGISDPAFLFDEKTGLLDLEKLPGNTETIRITWLDTDPSERNATFTMAGGLQWKPFSFLTATLATALRWNISKNSYTDSSGGSPGSYIISSGLSYEGPRLQASTAFAFEISVPDTTGFYRILGMDNKAVTFYPGKDWYIPTPPDIKPVLNGTALKSTDSTHLQTISDSSVSGSVLDLSCEFASKDNWASAEILAGSLGNADFSTARKVSIALKNAGDSDNFDISVQLGNGDSSFYEDPDTIRTWKLTPPPANSSWTVRTIFLTDADRAALSPLSNMRIIITAKTDGAIPPVYPFSARLYSGPIEITDTGFTVSADLSVEETGDPATTPLSVSESGIVGRFNNAKINTVLKASFAPEQNGQTITVSRSIPPVPIPLYNYLSFFIFPETLPDPTANPESLVKISFSRPSESEIFSDSFPILSLEMKASLLEEGKWQKITVDLGKRKVSRDGTVLPPDGAALTGSDNSGYPTHIEASFIDWLPPPDPSGAYNVFLDEFYLEETESENIIRNESAISWKKTGPVFSLGKTAIISDPSFSVNALSSQTVNASDPVVSGTAQGGFTLVKIKADGSVTASNTTKRITDSTKHSVAIPLGPFSATENFIADFSGNSVGRENSVMVSGALSAGVNTSVQQKSRNLDRRTAFRLSPSIPSMKIGQFSFSADSTFFQTGFSPFQDIDNTSWQDLWKDSFSYSFSTGESDALKRTGDTAFQTQWDSPVDTEKFFRLSGITFDGVAESLYSSGTSAALGSVLSFTLSLPFSVGLSTLTPAWQRSAGQTGNSGTGGSFISDTSFLGSSFQDQKWLYRIPPLSDLFDRDIPATIRDDGKYSRLFGNIYSILWKRPSPGLLSDLYLPSTLDTSVGRETKTDASVANIQDGYTASVKTGFSALNIAGSYGILHIFPWYEQDEISQLYGWSSKWGSSYFTWNMDTWHSLMLFFPGTGTFVSENAFHYESPSVSGSASLIRNTVRLIWKRQGKNSPVSLLAGKWTELPVFTKREDSTSFTFTNGKTSTAALEYDHLVKTGIGDNGEIQLSGGTGLTFSEAKITAMQLRLGISGKLMY